MPENLITTLAEYLTQPEQVLALTAHSFTVNRLGVIRSDEQTDLGDVQLDFQELSSRDRRQHLVTLVKIDCREVLNAQETARDHQARFVIF